MEKFNERKNLYFYFLTENKGVMIVMQYIVRFFIENFCLSGVIGSIHCFFSQVDNYFPFFAPYLPSPVHCSSFVNILINRKNIRFPSSIHHYKISQLHDSIIELNSSGIFLKDIELVHRIKVENLDLYFLLL